MFSFLPCVVYSVGVTTYLCYFSWIIENNFASVYRILMCLYTTFLCTKFQGNWITCFHFMVTFTPRQKEEEKKKKTKKLSQFLKVHILLMPGTIYLKIGVWSTDGSTAKIARFHISCTKSFYLWMWFTGFLGCTTHYLLIHY